MSEDCACRHLNGCPLSRPHLYDPDEGPLECTCADLRAEDAKPIIPRHLRPHAWFGDDPSGWCGCAGCEPSNNCGCSSCTRLPGC